MIKISKQNNSLIVEGIDNVFYPNNGDNSYPLNSLIVVTDNSDMATFRSVATNDVLFSGLINNITINGEAVTKDNIIQKFDAVSNSSTGGGGGGGSTVDAYTKEESDTKFATKTELTNVQTVANDADTKVDALTTRVEGVETAMNGKQDLLVSGTNIKTINNQSILGEGNIEISDYYTKTEADGKFATITGFNEQAANIAALQTAMDGKQPTLVSGTNIKTINGNSILGEGNLVIEGGGIDLSNYYTKTETDTKLDTKQNTLVSGENIKTINSESILGTGDIQINGVSEEQAQEIAKIPTLETELAQKANVSDVPTVQTGYTGTNKNYIYSDARSRYASVISKVDPMPSADTIDLRLYLWSPEKDANNVAYSTEPLTKATTSKAGVMSAADKTKLNSMSNEWTGTQSEYDALTTKDNNTIYYVTE